MLFNIESDNMTEYPLTMPKLGEGITEATILNWLKKEGETVSANEVILEIATDKVDTEVPSPVSGTIKRLLFQIEDTVAVDEVIAIIETEMQVESRPSIEIEKQETEKVEESSDEIKNDVKADETSNPLDTDIPNPEKEEEIPYVPKTSYSVTVDDSSLTENKTFSPLVKNIAKAEGISLAKLETIKGTGLNGRVTKDDILKYIKEGKRASTSSSAVNSETAVIPLTQVKAVNSSIHGQDEIIEMDRMRKLIAKNMVESKRISPHVTSFVEVDMTSVVQWRNRYKDSFKSKNGFSLTYMPIFVEAIVKAIIDYPLINVSVDGDKIIKKKNINIGIATALPSGNLIIPVIKNADRMNLTGLSMELNNLIQKARNNKLAPTDIQGGTYTISNIGSFDNILGTPIIPQPQVAIMAVGAIKKRPVVIETPQGDVIGIRHMMYLSHTYDHRVVDGALGGMFVKRVAEYLEKFDANQEI